MTFRGDWVGPLPLDNGQTVALDTTTHGELEQGKNLHEIVDAYSAPCDVVTFAVPAGQGVIVEFFLRRLFGGELAGSLEEFVAAQFGEQA